MLARWHVLPPLGGFGHECVRPPQRSSCVQAPGKYMTSCNIHLGKGAAQRNHHKIPRGRQDKELGRLPMSLPCQAKQWCGQHVGNCLGAGTSRLNQANMGMTWQTQDCTPRERRLSLEKHMASQAGVARTQLPAHGNRKARKKNKTALTQAAMQ